MILPIIISITSLLSYLSSLVLDYCDSSYNHRFHHFSSLISPFTHSRITVILPIIISITSLLSYLRSLVSDYCDSSYNHLHHFSSLISLGLLCSLLFSHISSRITVILPIIISITSLLSYLRSLVLDYCDSSYNHLHHFSSLISPFTRLGLL